MADKRIEMADGATASADKGKTTIEKIANSLNLPAKIGAKLGETLAGVNMEALDQAIGQGSVVPVDIDANSAWHDYESTCLAHNKLGGCPAGIPAPPGFEMDMTDIPEIFLNLPGMQAPLNRNSIPTVYTEGNNTRYGIVIISPGHGVATPGKRSPMIPPASRDTQFFEWDFNRNVAARMMIKMRELGINYHTFNMNGSSTGESPKTINPIIDKNYGGRAIVVSIHGNALGMGDTWTTNLPQNNSMGYWTVMSGNDGNQRSFANIKPGILNTFVAAFKKVFPEFNDFRTHPDYFKGDNFYLTFKGPLILTENWFYTTVNAWKFLRDPVTHDRIANAHVAAIQALL